MSKDYTKMIKDARDYQAANPHKSKSRSWYAYNTKAVKRLKAIVDERNSGKEKVRNARKSVRDQALANVKKDRSNRPLTELQKLNVARNKKRKAGMAIQTALRSKVRDFSEQRDILYNRRIKKADNELVRLKNRRDYDIERLTRRGGGVDGTARDEIAAYEKNYQKRLGELRSARTGLVKDFNDNTVSGVDLDKTGVSLSSKSKEKRVLEAIRLQQNNPNSYGSKGWYEFNKNSVNARKGALAERSEERDATAGVAATYKQTQTDVATKGNTKSNKAKEDAAAGSYKAATKAKDGAVFNPFGMTALKDQERDGYDDDQAIIKKDLKKKRRKGRKRSVVVRSKSTLRI